MRGMLYRAFMAARFNRATYRDVLRDQQAILNALGIVILAGIAYAVGQSSAVGESAEQGLDAGAIGDRLLGVWFASITFMVGWLIWAGIAYGVGRVFQRDEATFREVLRVLGIWFRACFAALFDGHHADRRGCVQLRDDMDARGGDHRSSGDKAIGLAGGDHGLLAWMGGRYAVAARHSPHGVLRYDRGGSGGVRMGAGFWVLGESPSP